MTGWTPVPAWDAEQPMRCDTCGEVLTGRELGYLPILCEQEKCPGVPVSARLRVRVAPVEDS